MSDHASSEFYHVGSILLALFLHRAAEARHAPVTPAL
jgi:hypothetical protein